MMSEWLLRLLGALVPRLDLYYDPRQDDLNFLTNDPEGEDEERSWLLSYQLFWFSDDGWWSLEIHLGMMRLDTALFSAQL